MVGRQSQGIRGVVTQAAREAQPRRGSGAAGSSLPPAKSGREPPRGRAHVIRCRFARQGAPSELPPDARMPPLRVLHSAVRRPTAPPAKEGMACWHRTAAHGQVPVGSVVFRSDRGHTGGRCRPRWRLLERRRCAASLAWRSGRVWVRRRVVRCGTPCGEPCGNALAAGTPCLGSRTPTSPRGASHGGRPVEPGCWSQPRRSDPRHGRLAGPRTSRTHPNLAPPTWPGREIRAHEHKRLGLTESDDVLRRTGPVFRRYRSSRKARRPTAIRDGDCRTGRRGFLAAHSPLSGKRGRHVGVRGSSANSSAETARRVEQTLGGSARATTGDDAGSCRWRCRVERSTGPRCVAKLTRDRNCIVRKISAATLARYARSTGASRCGCPAIAKAR
jgi:hypothetical protein